MPVNEIEKRVRGAGLRPTRQRIALAGLLFCKGNLHVCAEALHEKALDAGVRVSLATVYNTLHQFTRAGLLRAFTVEGSKTWFDTNVSNHCHFFIEDEDRILDIDLGGDWENQLPEPPEGMEIVGFDFVVRLRPKPLS
jgi:Fur family iron response transcriptional regulator